MIDIHPDRFYLTSTGRLARDPTRRFRLQRLREGEEGWEPLRAVSLNAWLETESWPDQRPNGLHTRVQWSAKRNCNPS